MMEQEVDVKLFITCRMCLDEPGAFQIVPSIKGQINFCFSIDIDPFDGLPQLICKKCKGTLTEYYALKTKFLEKQQELMKKLSKNNLESSDKSPAAANGAATLGHSVTSLDTNVIAHAGNSSASDIIIPPGNVTVKSPAAAVTSPAPQGKSRKKKASWKKKFNRYFVCIICNKEYLTEKSIKKHSKTHKKVMSKHEKIFKSYLTVRMNKIDEKENSTGCLQNVVYSNDKVISNRGNSNYYSFYLKKGFRELFDSETDENEHVANKRPAVLSDSSEDEIIKGKKRKSGRLFSISSTQTVILEERQEKCTNSTVLLDNHSNSNEKETVNINDECINLDDSSSECPPNNSTEPEKTRKMLQRHQPKARVADYKAIQTIVTMCHKNYTKKLHLAEADTTTKSAFSESSLKHKVLSLGRKVINKQGFSCTGLLRYMEHKDLDITWTPSSSAMQNKGSNFVRIMTKLKSREDSENEDAGWTNMHDVSFCRENDVESNTSRCLTSENGPAGGAAQASPPPRRLLEGTLPSARDHLNHSTRNDESDYKKELLSNIKPDTNSVDRVNDVPTLPPVSATAESEDGQVDDTNMYLPIITSTTSLSCPSEKEKQEVPVVEKPPPRIKVKPASELMSERVLNNQDAVNDVWAFNMSQCTLPRPPTLAAVRAPPASVPESQSHVSTPTSGNLPAVTSQNHSQPADGSHREGGNNRNLEYVTLHCPDLPNTRTKSPFGYFKKVLLVHGLKLLDLNDNLPQHFNCLVKFQLMLRQDSKKPIKVLFSLFSSKSTFCFTFKDAFLKTFDPNQLPAFWQWELLKVYRGDVADKILQNSIKIGKDVHEFTKHFLCLLKSIDLIIES